MAAPELVRELEAAVAAAARLARAPDAGNLLLALMALPDGLVARALDQLGVSAGALRAALERARAKNE